MELETNDDGMITTCPVLGWVTAPRLLGGRDARRGDSAGGSTVRLPTTHRRN